jgi:hypothetical protein
MYDFASEYLASLEAARVRDMYRDEHQARLAEHRRTLRELRARRPRDAGTTPAPFATLAAQLVGVPAALKARLSRAGPVEAAC